jgi:hypothetical protein
LAGTALTKTPPSRLVVQSIRRDCLYPAATCALNHKSVWELLVATILSAQCTDATVNRVTPELFRKQTNTQVTECGDKLKEPWLVTHLQAGELDSRRPCNAKMAAISEQILLSNSLPWIPGAAFCGVGHCGWASRQVRLLP